MADTPSRWAHWRYPELRSRRLRVKLRGTRSSSALKPLGNINIDICGPAFYAPFQTPLMSPKSASACPPRPQSVVFCSEVQMSAAMEMEMRRGRAASASTSINRLAHSAPLAQKPLPHVPAFNSYGPVELPGSLLLKDKGFQPASEYSVLHWGRGPEKLSPQFLRDIGIVDNQSTPTGPVACATADERPAPPASVDSHDSGIGTPSDSSPGSSCDMAPFFSRANASRYSVLPRFERPGSSGRSITSAKTAKSTDSSNVAFTHARADATPDPTSTDITLNGLSEAQRVNQVFQRHIKELTKTLEERDGNVLSLTKEVAEMEDAYDVLQKHHDEKLASLKVLLNYLDKLRKDEPTTSLHEQVKSSLRLLFYLDGAPKKSSRHRRSASMGTITSQPTVDIPTILIKPSSPRSSTRASSEQNVAELWSRLRSKEELEKSLRTSEKQALDDVRRLLDDVESLSQRDRARAETIKEYHHQFLDLGATITGTLTNGSIDLDDLEALEHKSVLDQQCQTWKATVANLKTTIEERDGQIARLEAARQEQISELQSEISWLSKDNEILEDKLHRYLGEKEEARILDQSQKGTIEQLSNKLLCREEEIATLVSPIASPSRVLRCLDLPATSSLGSPVSPMGHIPRSKFSTQTLEAQSPRSQSMASGLSSGTRLVTNMSDLGHLQRLVEALELKRKQYKNEISGYRREREGHKNEISDLKAQVKQMQEDEQKSKAEIDKWKSETSQKDGKLRQIIDIHRNQKTSPSSPLQSPGGRRRPSLENTYQSSQSTESVTDLAARAQHFVLAIRKLDGTIEDCNSRVSHLLQELVIRDTRDARGMEIVEVRRQLAEASEQRSSHLVSIESCLSAIAEASETRRERRPSTSSSGALSPQLSCSASFNWARPLNTTHDSGSTIPLASLVELSGESAPVQSSKTGRKRSPSSLATSIHSRNRLQHG